MERDPRSKTAKVGSEHHANENVAAADRGGKASFSLCCGDHIRDAVSPEETVKTAGENGEQKKPKNTGRVLSVIAAKFVDVLDEMVKIPQIINAERQKSQQ